MVKNNKMTDMLKEAESKVVDVIVKKTTTKAKATKQFKIKTKTTNRTEQKKQQFLRRLIQKRNPQYNRRLRLRQRIRSKKKQFLMSTSRCAMQNRRRTMKS